MKIVSLPLGIFSGVKLNEFLPALHLIFARWAENYILKYRAVES
jgi:hypothetical protein